jgi:biopolymer transport protein ExbD
MSFGAFDPQRQQPLLAEINVTPMVDVMLVLLVIFILAAPMFTPAVKLDLPRTPAAATPRPAAAVTLAIDASGQVFWEDEPVTPAELEVRLARAATLAPPPELQLRADKDARYEVVAQVMAAAQSNGLTKLGFVTEPLRKKK